MHKKLILIFVLGLLYSGVLMAQHLLASIDSIPANKDSLMIVHDSLVLVTAIDTITPSKLRPLDSLQIAKIDDSLHTGFVYETFDLQKLINNYHLTENIIYQKGNKLPHGEKWIIDVIAFLLVLFAVLKNVFARQLEAIVQSFYSNRQLINLNKEENLVDSWSFLLLFVQFGFTIGMFFYLAARFENIPNVKDGFKFFIVISVAIIILYLLKIGLLKIVGFIFNIQKPLNEYISILYLSYFNVSLLFFPLVVAFALSPLKLGYFYIKLGISLLCIIFIIQLIRASVNILSQYRFSKVHLFLYFCTLEICPILILIKAVGL